MSRHDLHEELVAAKGALLEVAPQYREATESLRDAVALVVVGDTSRATLAIDPHDEEAPDLLATSIDAAAFAEAFGRWTTARRTFLARLERLEKARAALDAHTKGA